MSFPTILYVLKCIHPEVQAKYPGIPFEADQVGEEFIITLHKPEGDEKISDTVLLDLKTKPKKRRLKS